MATRTAEAEPAGGTPGRHLRRPGHVHLQEEDATMRSTTTIRAGASVRIDPNG